MSTIKRESLRIGDVISYAVPGSSLVLHGKPRHGWFTNPGSEDDQCPIHQDGGKIFLSSEQIIVVMELFP